MKLTIFGATGRAGRQLVAEAIERGHQVTAFARSPEKLAAYQGQIEIVAGDVQEPTAVARAVAGADAVLSVLGPTENKPDYQVTKGTQNILAAMKEHGVKRLVVSAGAGVGDPKDEPKLFHKVINVLLKLFSRHVYEDMVRVVDTVRASDLDWTIVRVPMLTDEPAHGSLKVGYVGQGPGPRLSRADMARFMLDQVAESDYIHAAPVVSN